MNREQAERNIRRISDAMMEGPLTHELEGMLVKSLAWLAFDIADSLTEIAMRLPRELRDEDLVENR